MSGSAAAMGRAGEQIAVRHLERLGMRVLTRNWRCATAQVRGEVDVIAWDGRTLVFCEVKTRRDDAAGGPLAAITGRKQQRLRRLAAAFLADSGLQADDVRFDVVGVWAGGDRARVEHLR
ncbi:MAG: YraN family protein, partial [Actinomycetota bacterium]|nr:YraN family protein [Actinomycetota bacterium]